MIHDHIEINPPGPVKKSIIWLHGLGADGNDFVPVVNALQLPANAGIRFVFPHAPVIPVTLNQGYKMRAWYDINGLSIEENLDHRVDADGIHASIDRINRLIAHEETLGTPTNQIILAGFSQGAVIALTCGLRHAKPLGGILALSGYLPLAEPLFQTAPIANKAVPIFMAHGTEDTIVPYSSGEIAYKLLKREGYHVEWHSYPMPHSVSPAEIKDISQWIQLNQQ